MQDTYCIAYSTGRMTAKVGYIDEKKRLTESSKTNNRIEKSDMARCSELDRNPAGNVEKNKRGFRIDDILFSVERKTEKSFKTELAEYRSTPSPSNTSDSSHHSTDESLSPVSFIKRPQALTLTKTHHMERPHIILSPIDHHSASILSSSSPYQYSRSSSMNEDIDCDDSCSQASNDSKKPRTSFTPDQIQTLEDAFNEKHYLNHTERTLLAEELSLTDCQIKTWFQNRRMKMKRQYKEAVEKGYLIPYHPYPFPRYSRLTPAHFASVPALNTRHMKTNNNYTHQSSSGNTCTCCTPSNRIYSQSSFTKTLRTVRNCSDYVRSRPRSPPDVLPRRRTLERRDLHPQYSGELREYFQNLPLRTELKERTKKYV